MKKQEDDDISDDEKKSLKSKKSFAQSLKSRTTAMGRMKSTINSSKTDVYMPKPEPLLEEDTHQYNDNLTPSHFYDLRTYLAKKEKVLA